MYGTTPKCRRLAVPKNKIKHRNVPWCAFFLNSLNATPKKDIAKATQNLIFVAMYTKLIAWNRNNVENKTVRGSRLYVLLINERAAKAKKKKRKVPTI
jgi:hypothetical protein